jgi:hypothetical protein
MIYKTADKPAKYLMHKSLDVLLKDISFHNCKITGTSRYEDDSKPC